MSYLSDCQDIFIPKKTGADFESVILTLPPVSMLNFHDLLTEKIPDAGHEWWKKEDFAKTKYEEERPVEFLLKPFLGNRIPKGCRKILGREYFFLCLYLIDQGESLFSRYMYCSDLVEDRRLKLSWRLCIRIFESLDVVAFGDYKQKAKPWTIAVRDLL